MKLELEKQNSVYQNKPGPDIEMQQAVFPTAIEQMRQQIMATDFEAAASDDNEIMFTF